MIHAAAYNDWTTEARILPPIQCIARRQSTPTQWSGRVGVWKCAEKSHANACGICTQSHTRSHPNDSSIDEFRVYWALSIGDRMEVRAEFSQRNESIHTDVQIHRNIHTRRKKKKTWLSTGDIEMPASETHFHKDPHIRTPMRNQHPKEKKKNTSKKHNVLFKSR